MKSPAHSLELIQSTLNYRFAGDLGALTLALEKIEEELDRPGKPMFERVGNNNLVFFTNRAAMEVCEQHPDTIQGNIINDYNCRINPGSVVIGSVIQGFAGSHGCGPTISNVGLNSHVFYSTVSGGHVRNSTVIRSTVTGQIDGSTIIDSSVRGKLRNMQLVRCGVSVGAIANETAKDFFFEYDSRQDRPDTNGRVARLLERYRLRKAPHLVESSDEE